MNSDGGQIIPKDSPRGTPIEARQNSEFCTHIEGLAPDGILAQHIDRSLGQTFVQTLPGLAQILAAPNQGPQVILAITTGCHIGALFVVFAEHHPGNPPTLGQTRQATGQVRPAVASILGQLHQPVIGTYHQEVRTERTLGYGSDRTVRHIAFDFHRIPTGQVIGDQRPVISAIQGAEQTIASKPQDLRIVLREQNGRIPIEAVLLTIGGLGLDALALPSTPVPTIDPTKLGLPVDDVRVARFNLSVETVTTTHGRPLL